MTTNDVEREKAWCGFVRDFLVYSDSHFSTRLLIQVESVRYADELLVQWDKRFREIMSVKSSDERDFIGMSRKG